jgi:hypothetical protein
MTYNIFTLEQRAEPESVYSSQDAKIASLEQISQASQQFDFQVSNTEYPTNRGNFKFSTNIK